jgi:hypothetical protein
MAPRYRCRLPPAGHQQAHSPGQPSSSLVLDTVSPTANTEGFCEQAGYYEEAGETGCPKSSRTLASDFAKKVKRKDSEYAPLSFRLLLT